MIKIFLSIICFIVGALLLALAFTITSFWANVIVGLGAIMIFGSIIFAFIVIMRKIVN